MTEENEVSGQLNELGLTVNDSPNSEKEQEIRDENQLAFLHIASENGAAVFIYCHGPLTIYIMDPMPTKGQYHVNAKFAFKDDVIGYSRVTLNSDRSVSAKAREIYTTWPDIPIPYPTIKNDLRLLQDDLRNKISEHLGNKPIEDLPPIMSTEEEQAAMEVLKDPNLFDRLIDVFDEIGVVREHHNRLTAYVTCTSRKLVKPQRPINVIYKGESSSGKSFVVTKTLELMPPEDWEDFTDTSRKYFLYKEKTSLVHKIVYIQEQPGADAANDSIRVLQSEDKISIGTVIKDPQTGEFKAIKNELDGPIMFLTTTTRPQVNPENETRNLMLFSDDSSEQTKLINRHIMARMNSQHSNVEDLIQLWRNVQRLVKPYPVHFNGEFAQAIAETFPVNQLRVRRDIEKFANLVSAITLLFQYQRKHVEIDGVEKLEATPSDYGFALLFSGASMSKTIASIPPKTQEIVEYVRDVLIPQKTSEIEVSSDPIDDEPVAPTFTWPELYNGMRWKRGVTIKWARMLIDEGIFEIVDGGRGRAKNQRMKFNNLAYGFMGIGVASEWLKDWNPSFKMQQFFKLPDVK